MILAYSNHFSVLFIKITFLSPSRCLWVFVKISLLCVCVWTIFGFSLWLIYISAAVAAVSSVVSDSVRPHRQQPIRLPCPWDSPGKNIGVGCHFLLQCMKVKRESEVALCNAIDCSPPGSSIHGIFQIRVLEWGAIAFSKFIYLSFVNITLYLLIQLCICIKIRLWAYPNFAPPFQNCLAAQIPFILYTHFLICFSISKKKMLRHWLGLYWIYKSSRRELTS